MTIHSPFASIINFFFLIYVRYDHDVKAAAQYMQTMGFYGMLKISLIHAQDKNNENDHLPDWIMKNLRG